jgi:hypothetical protein
MIIDYSTGRPSIAQLKAAGVTAAGRYIGWDSVPGFSSIGKNITRAEAAALTGAGIDVFLAFEYAAQAVLGGAAQGKKDGQLATQQLHNLGAPADMTVYFAIDFDIPDYAPHSADPKAKLGAATAYFEAINALNPSYKVGVYGGYYAVKRVLDAGLARAGWQTVAWSGGQQDSRALLRQLASQVMGFADVNLHVASGADFGQWPRPRATTPAPPPVPGPGGSIVADGHTSLRDLAHAHGTTAWQMAVATVMARGGKLGDAEQLFLSAIFNGNLTPDAAPPKGTLLWA